MAKQIRILTVVFDTEIKYKEIPLFRGAVLKSLGDKADLLYHNHTGATTFRYSYPLIQYKRIHKKASIMAIGEGVGVVSQLLEDSCHFNFQIGKEKVEMKIETIDLYDNEITLTEGTEFRYCLRGWHSLNSKNYVQYQNTESIVGRITILEDVLIGNILSFLKGIGIHLNNNEQIKLHITDIIAQRNVVYKKVKLMAFDIEFKANISLPQYIGLGKSASVGCGVITRIMN